MIKLRIIFTSLTLFLFFSNCGYTPIFSKKEVNFNIENIEFSGDKNVKEKINNVLSAYKNKPDKAKKISLVIKSSKNIIIASKNLKGEAETNRIVLDINVKIILEENKFFEKNFSKSSIYSITDRKSEQIIIENKLIKNLSNDIAQQIILEILEKIK